MPQSTLVWLLSGMIGVMLTVLAFLGKTILKQVLKKLDNIIEELRNLTRVTIIQEEQIYTIREKVNDLGDRVTKLENKP